ncbi:F-box/LRR-repeat protein 2 [Heterodontus francisci]|uniref:F-box/LRR-repeat protein 2 n=1 Tax=Heterodontus francisci TaxID=7792 RepID=UPI00355B6F3C
MPRRQRVRTLKQLCLSNVAANMKEVWAKDYIDNYLTDYNFLYIMGPFNDLASSLVQDLLQLLGDTHRLTRAFLQLLLVPHLVELNLRSCSGLVSNAIGQIIHIRCQGLTALNLHGCSRIQSSILVDLIECLPRLRKLTLSSTQCNSQVLSAIGFTCRELRELDLSRCKEVTSLGLLHLVYDRTQAAFYSLQLRNLLTEGITLSPDADLQHVVVMAFVLLTLPSLRYVTHTFLMEALTLIHGQLFRNGQEFLQSSGFPSLAEVALTSGANAPQAVLRLRRLDVSLGQDLSILTSTCRDVAEATIALDDSLRDLWHLNSWKKLTHLTLECSGFHGRPLSDMVPVLSCLGPRLQLLSLQNFQYHLEASLGNILEFCPNLRVFRAQLHPSPQEFNSAPVNEDSDDEGGDNQQDRKRLFPANWRFLHLKDFSLRIEDSAPLPRSLQLSMTATLISTLQGSPQLHKLSLINIPVSLDKIFQNVLEQPASLVQLSELCLAQSCVSSVAVCLLLAADNQLTSLDLRHCRDIHRRHFDQFVEDAKRSKFDLKIFWE